MSYLVVTNSPMVPDRQLTLRAERVLAQAAEYAREEDALLGTEHIARALIDHDETAPHWKYLRKRRLSLPGRKSA